MATPQEHLIACLNYLWMWGYPLPPLPPHQHKTTSIMITPYAGRTRNLSNGTRRDGGTRSPLISLRNHSRTAASGGRAPPRPSLAAGGNSVSTAASEPIATWGNWKPMHVGGEASVQRSHQEWEVRRSGGAYQVGRRGASPADLPAWRPPAGERRGRRFVSALSGWPLLRSPSRRWG